MNNQQSNQGQNRPTQEDRREERLREYRERKIEEAFSPSNEMSFREKFFWGLAIIAMPKIAGGGAARALASDNQTQRIENGNYPALVRGCRLFCEYGSHSRQLEMPYSHGVSLKKLTLAYALDNKDCSHCEDMNIPVFGVCSSTMHEQFNNTFLIGGLINTFNRTKITLRSEDGQSNVRGFACQVSIVDEWFNPYTQIQVATNESYQEDLETREYSPVITAGSFLVCRYGGMIIPISTGIELAEE